MFLVTGAAGFIGFHMCKFLLKKKFKVIGLDSLNNYYSKSFKLKRLSILKKERSFKFIKLDICKSNKLDQLFKKNNFKTIIHLAAQPGVVYSYEDPKSYTINNVNASKVLFELIKKYKIKNFIFTSSSSVYGDHKKYPINENFTFKPKNHYAKTKVKCEKIIKKVFKNFNINLKIIRPFTVYGPFGRPDMLILKMLSKIKNKKHIDIYNYGKHLRDFTYVDDVVRIIYKLSLREKKGIEVFNICASKPIEINNILEITKKILKKNIKIRLKRKRKGEMNITYGSNEKLLKKLKYKKFTEIESGLKKTIKWYKSFSNKKVLNRYK
tara:strand:- start:1141 stop:2112 length:972 start_codon:yes stop_codon:yes gene_type:complete